MTLGTASGRRRTRGLRYRAPSPAERTARFDPLRDEGIAYADRLDDHGAQVIRTNYDEMIHGFLSFSELDAAREARTAIAGTLSEQFGAQAPVE